MPVKSDRALSQILQNDDGEVPKSPGNSLFYQEKTDESEKECYNSNVAAGKRYCTGPAARIKDYKTVLS